MSVTTSNQLLSDAAQPADGINYADVKLWYGGPIRVAINGEFGGATIKLVASARLPDQSAMTDPSDPDEYAALFKADDWATLGEVTADGVIALENLNPCLLAVDVASATGTTRVKAIIT